MRFVVSLQDARACDPALVGAKAAHLAALLAGDVPVPEGFCVTAEAYRALADDAEIRRRISALDELDPGDGDTLAEAGKALRGLLSGRDLPAELDREIRQTAGAIGGGRVAVRSSATVEDLPGVSAAGQHESFLAVEQDGLAAAVRGSMASLFTDRAIAYRASRGVSHERAALAVLVQRQVDADAAGVLFTADPQSGSRRVAVIEAGPGTGEKLVGGHTDADHIRIHLATGERTYDGSGERVLSGDQVEGLIRLGQHAERTFGAPQDVEWARVGDRLLVLQARPITGLFPVPEPAPRDGRLHIYLSWGHTQAFAEAMPPLVADLWATYLELGFPGIRPVVVQAAGRIYLDLTPLLRVGWLRRRLVHNLPRVSEPAAAGLRVLLDRRRGELGAYGLLQSTRRLPGAARLYLPGWWPLLLRMLGAFLRRPADPQREQATWDRWAARVAATVRHAEQPIDRVRAVFEPDTRQLRELYPMVGPLFAGVVAGGVIERWFADEPQDVNDVGAGFRDDVVTRINLGLGDLADLAREQPAVAGALRAGDGIEAICRIDGGERFAAALEDYLNEFGHRATGEVDISRPRWREDPSPLLRVVAANLATQESGVHHRRLRRLEDGARAAGDRLARRAASGRFGWLRRRVFRRLLRTYRGHIVLREHPKQGLAHLFAAWREAIRDAGWRLAGSGALNHPDDVWYLRRDELFAALWGAPVDADLRARRAAHTRNTELSAPPLLTSEGEAPQERDMREDVPEHALVGTPVSAGVVEGPARVIADPAAATIEPGEILVTPSTDPGWTPLFLNANGLVTEVGGKLSHGALVAREYGLPAVAAVAGATATIGTGRSLRVDGGKGTVELLD